MDFPCFFCLMDIFVGVCDTQGVVMKEMTGMAVLGDFSHFVGSVRVPNGPPQGACSLQTVRHIYCTTSKKICLISSIFQGVLFGTKGWCMVTPYHPFSTLWKIHVDNHDHGHHHRHHHPDPDPDVYHRRCHHHDHHAEFASSTSKTNRCCKPLYDDSGSKNSIQF